VVKVRGDGLIKRMFLNYQIRKYVRKLFYYLARDVGIRERYKIRRIDQIIKRYGFNKRYSYIAYAMFLDEKNYNKAKNYQGFVEDRDDVINLVAQRYFDSNPKFTKKDLFRVSVFKDWNCIFNGDLSVIDYAAYNLWKNHSSGGESISGSVGGELTP